MIVCVCNAIREDELRAAARDGATEPFTAYKSLGCEPQCGCCLGCAQEIIDDEHGQLRRRGADCVVIEFQKAA